MKQGKIITLVTILSCILLSKAMAQVKLYDMVVQCNPYTEFAGSNSRESCAAIDGFLTKNGDKYSQLLKKCINYKKNPQGSLPEECINASIFELYYSYSNVPNLVFETTQKFNLQYFGTVQTLINEEDEKIHPETHTNLCAVVGKKLRGGDTGMGWDVYELNKLNYRCCLLTKYYTHCKNVRDDLYVAEDGGVDKGINMKMEALKVGAEDETVKSSLEFYKLNLENRKKYLLRLQDDERKKRKFDAMQNEIQL